MKDNKRIIFDNYNTEEYFSDEEIRQIAIDCEWIDENDELTDDQIFQYRQDEVDRWFSDEWDMLTDYFSGKTVIFFGSVELWTGRHKAGKIGSFEDLYHAAMKDCDYVKIYDENGHLYIECSHHDGTNIFEVKELTQAGIDYIDRWEYSTDSRTEQDAHNQIIKRYSHLPHYAKKVFG